jgi:hypothetical protein
MQDRQTHPETQDADATRKQTMIAMLVVIGAIVAFATLAMTPLPGLYLYFMGGS